jgi:hypothetical protein
MTDISHDTHVARDTEVTAAEGLPSLRLVPKTTTPQTKQEFTSDQEVSW